MSIPLNVSPEDKIAALRIARAKVEKYGSGICCRLPHTPAGNAISSYIMEQIAPRLWLGTWLEDHRPGLPLDRASLTRYRLAWIDWMIACLEEDIAARSRPPNVYAVSA